MIKHISKNKKGFTLIEIIVVLVIMGILLAIAIPSILGYVKKAEEAKFMAAVRTVNVEATTYAEEYMIKSGKDFSASSGANGRETAIGYLKLVFTLSKSIKYEGQPAADKGRIWLDEDFVKAIQAIPIPNGYTVKQIDLEFDHKSATDRLGWEYDPALKTHSITKVSVSLKKAGKPNGIYVVTLLNKQMYVYDLDDSAGAAKASEAFANGAEEAPVLVPDKIEDK